MRNTSSFFPWGRGAWFGDPREEPCVLIPVLSLTWSVMLTMSLLLSKLCFSHLYNTRSDPTAAMVWHSVCPAKPSGEQISAWYSFILSRPLNSKWKKQNSHILEYGSLLKETPFTLSLRNAEQNALCDFSQEQWGLQKPFPLPGLHTALFTEEFLVGLSLHWITSPLKALGSISVMWL